ncbi:hypothetical protein ACFPFV_12475 [Salinicoccus siamensis]|uniref:hypothetical protein n=1 Tax=Salinicoccus siamensis TaxID=381830 RepID=UPI003615AC9C
MMQSGLPSPSSQQLLEVAGRGTDNVADFLTVHHGTFWQQIEENDCIDGLFHNLFLFSQRHHILPSLILDNCCPFLNDFNR